MFIFVVNFSFVIQNVSFGIRGVIAKITLEILLSLVYMSSLEKKRIYVRFMSYLTLDEVLK